MSAEENVGQRIKAARVKLGIPGRDLAERAGVDRHTLRRLEEGDERVRASTVAMVLETLARLGREVGIPDLLGPESVEVEVVVFRVLADHSSDLDWIDKVGTELVNALRESGLLRRHA